jgi:phage/plasmid-associated DNA primase
MGDVNVGSSEAPQTENISLLECELVDETSSVCINNDILADKPCGSTDNERTTNLSKLRRHRKTHGLFCYGNYEDKYESKKLADQAQCNVIADLIKADHETIDRYFRESKLYSFEWENENYRNEIIKNAIDYVENGGDHEEGFNTEKCYEKLCRVKPNQVMSTRIQQALNFIKFQMCSKKCELSDITAIEMFIEEHVFSYFDIGFGKNNKTGSIFRNGFKPIIAKKKKEIETAIKTEREQNDLRINEKYNGMYTLYVVSKTDDRMRINPHVDKIADMILEENNILTYEESIFIYRDGYYRPGDAEIETIAMSIINDICKGDNSDHTERKKTDVMNHIKSKSRVYEYPFNRHKNAIPVRNGVVIIDLETFEIRLEKNPSPSDWRFNYMLDVDYDKAADSTTILEVLKSYLYDHNQSGETIDYTHGRYDYRIFTQILAQGILESMDYGPYKALYAFVGKTDSGKTTAIDIIGWFVGRNAYGIVGLEALTSDNRFAVAGLEGKIFNLCDDVGYFKMSETGKLKTLTGRHMHDIEHKGVDKYAGFISAVHIVSTNNPAGFDRRIYNDEAFWARWYYVKFPNSFQKNGEFTRRTFTDANKSALLNEVLKSIVEILKTHSLPIEKENWKCTREKWMQESNPLFTLLEDVMVSGGQTAILKHELSDMLRAHCEDTKRTDLLPHGYKALGEMVELCGGVADAQREFTNENGLDTPDKKHCYILDGSFKTENAYADTYYITRPFIRQSDITNKKFLTY